MFEDRKARRASIDVNEAYAIEIDHSAGSFIRDGVVCPDEWFAAGVRPLYLLKEAYGDGGRDLGADHLLTEEKNQKKAVFGGACPNGHTE